MPRITFSRRALIDLEEIGDYIARDNPRRAASFVDELQAHCVAVAANPTSYGRREDIGQGVRMAVHGRYLIIFRSIAEGVEIVRILHGSRRLPRLD